MSEKGFGCTHNILPIPTPILHEPEMAPIPVVVEDFEKGTFGLRGHGVEADLEGGEESVDVGGGDGDVDVEADAVEGGRGLHVGGHGDSYAGMGGELDVYSTQVSTLSEKLFCSVFYVDVPVDLH